MNDKRKNIFMFISGMFFTITFVGLVWFIKTRMTFLLDSDDASELILGNLLNKENRLLSRSWYYSTELRVLNTQIFYAFFFKIFHSWHRVRIASYVCLYIAMLATYYFTCRALKLKKYFWITASLLMIPFSRDYFYIVLKGAYYIPHIAITFFTLGLCESYVACEKEGKKRIYLPVALLCSILAGLGGARQIIILYAPLIIAAGILWISRVTVSNSKVIAKLEQSDKKYILFSTALFIGAGIGYIINIKLLSRIYSFATWTDVSFAEFDISKLSQIIKGFLHSYGYSSGKVLSSILLGNFSCLCWVFLTVYSCFHILKNRKTVEPSHYRIALFTITDFALYICLYMFTDLYYVNRYNLPIIVLSIPMIAVLFKNTELKDVFNYAAVTAFVLLVACSGFWFCKEQYKIDKTGELRTIVTVLQQEGYTQGYATFWHANVLTELSDGAVEVWDWQSPEMDGITVESIDDTYKWLQLKSHDYTHPEGKIFLLFTQEEWEKNPWKGKLSTECIIYQSDEYIVIGYEDYEKLKNDTLM